MNRVENTGPKIGSVQAGKGFKNLHVFLEEIKSFNKSEICKKSEILHRISAIEIDGVSQVCRLVGGILLTQADPTSDTALVSEAEGGLKAVLVAKTAVTIATIIVGVHMAASALLKLSGSEAKMPSIKTFATLAKIPKGGVAVYSLYHTAVTRGEEEKNETALDKKRLFLRYGSRFSKAEDKSKALRKNAISQSLDIATIAGILTNFVLDTLGYEEAAKWVDRVTTGVVVFQGIYDAHDFITDKDNQAAAKGFLSKLRERLLPSKIQQFWTDSSAG